MVLSVVSQHKFLLKSCQALSEVEISIGRTDRYDFPIVHYLYVLNKELTGNVSGFLKALQELF